MSKVWTGERRLDQGEECGPRRRVWTGTMTVDREEVWAEDRKVHWRV